MTEENKQATQQAQAVDKNHPANPAMPTAPDLTVSDLQALRTIIEVAQTRGAFKAAEMAVVGNTYNRLIQFLDAVKPAPEQQQAEGQPAPKAPTTDPVASAVAGVPTV
jgi:hypothetical protein